MKADLAMRQRIEARVNATSDLSTPIALQLVPRQSADFMARLDAINKLSSSATKRQVDLFGGARKEPK